MNRSFDDESGVSHLIEYLIISGVLVILMIVTLLSLNLIFIENPTNQLSYYAFTDIGNGISTRIVDLYVIAPDYGNINTNFDIPDDVGGTGYMVDIESDPDLLGLDTITTYRGSLSSVVSLSGIGATTGVSGHTTGSGLNIISYTSEE
jgi:hypothetical protein